MWGFLLTNMYIFGQDDTTSEKNQRQPDTITVEADPLKIELKDDVLIRVIEKRIEDSKSFYKKELNLYERRKRNRKYLSGNQLPAGLKNYSARYIDNLIYEGEGTIKPIALSRLPDLIVKPGNDTDESKKIAEDITSVINSDIRKRENRKCLGLSFKHLPVYFQGVLKAVWDPQKGDDGDYRFKVVHPDNIIIDHTATTNNPDDMDFIAEATEISIKEATMRFPKRAEKLLNVLAVDVTNGFNKGDENSEAKMASKIKIWEVWFTWWNSVTDKDTGEKKWERIEGVVWKYKNLILAKMRNPYWDWQGKRRLFRYELGKKKQLSEDDLRTMIFGEDDTINSEMYYFNHFRDPKKPYYFMGYEQWGEHPMDITSRIEQVVYMQDNVNKRGRQITEMNDRAKGKHVFSTDSGLTKDDVENMDMDNPNEDLIVNGDIRLVHTFIPGTPAPAQLYQEQELERNKVFSKMGVHSTTRGERQPGTQETATGRQIMRESDFGKIDDLVEDTINPAAEWMAKWAMQFIKLFYTKAHMRKLLGKDGEVTFSKISRDSIEDGMEVMVSASGVDKLERKREAFERAKMQLTDPLSFFIDTDASDPLGRTEKLLTFMSSPELYMQKFVKKLDTQGMANELSQQPVGMQQGQEQETPQQLQGGI